MILTNFLGIWRITFAGPLSAPREVLEYLYGQSRYERLFTPLTAQLDGFITNTILNTIAEGDYVVLQTQGKTQTKTGKAYNNTYCLVIQLQDSKIQQITEYLDTELVTAAFE